MEATENPKRVGVETEDGLMTVRIRSEDVSTIGDSIRREIRRRAFDYHGPSDFASMETLSRIGFGLERDGVLANLSHEDAEELLTIYWPGRVGDVEDELERAVAKGNLRRTGKHDPVWQDLMSKEMREILSA